MSKETIRPSVIGLPLQQARCPKTRKLPQAIRKPRNRIGAKALLSKRQRNRSPRSHLAYPHPKPKSETEAFAGRQLANSTAYVETRTGIWTKGTIFGGNAQLSTGPTISLPAREKPKCIGEFSCFADEATVNAESVKSFAAGCRIEDGQVSLESLPVMVAHSGVRPHPRALRGNAALNSRWQPEIILLR